jgi:hypothetical protein
MRTKAETKRVDAANRELRKLTFNKFFEAVPFGKIDDILEKQGFKHYRHGTFDGVYVGTTGKVADFISENSYVIVEWYKMPTGRFEVNTYVS